MSYTANYTVREHIDLFCNPNSSLRLDPIKSHQLIQYSVRCVFQKGHRTCGGTAYYYGSTYAHPKLVSVKTEVGGFSREMQLPKKEKQERTNLQVPLQRQLQVSHVPQVADRT